MSWRKWRLCNSKQKLVFLRSLDILKGQRFPERNLAICEHPKHSLYLPPAAIFTLIITAQRTIPPSKRFFRQNEALCTCPISLCRRRFRCANRAHGAGKGASMPERSLQCRSMLCNRRSWPCRPWLWNSWVPNLIERGKHPDLALADLFKASSTPYNTKTFTDTCAKVGQRARCCTLPVVSDRGCSVALLKLLTLSTFTAGPGPSLHCSCSCLSHTSSQWITVSSSCSKGLFSMKGQCAGT